MNCEDCGKPLSWFTLKSYGRCRPCMILYLQVNTKDINARRERLSK